MIFVPTRKIGEALQSYLRDQDLKTPFYHSKLASAWERSSFFVRSLISPASSSASTTGSWPNRSTRRYAGQFQSCGLPPMAFKKLHRRRQQAAEGPKEFRDLRKDYK